MRMAYPVLYLPLHLIQSALGQKVEAKPRGQTFRERRQGRSARICREVACLPGRAGSRISRAVGRASPLRAKSVSLSAQKGVLAVAYAVSCVQIGAVLHAITSDVRLVHSTDLYRRAIRKTRKASPTRRCREQGLIGPGFRDVSKSRVVPRPRGMKGATVISSSARCLTWRKLAPRLRPPNGQTGPPPANPSSR